MRHFDELISYSEAIDLPLQGRKFTWYRAGGDSMSRLDRILISEVWLSSWSDSSQWGLDRDMPDHCPPPLKEMVRDWGPKPFRMLKCWKELLDGYSEMVKDLWTSSKFEWLLVGANPRYASTWEPVIEKENGGLGIKNIKTFNLTLLGKWMRIMWAERENLWYQILKTKYGQENRRIKSSGRNTSRWLKDIEEVGNLGG
ncbi:unnamed protein product [Vicia faba]|uniref:Uncharacterized protein n=1 Tax=Vicia faba TaxID=3906 RepID=A0AAV1AV01_VICFA|nr:unnamed protein product [Vicia faba]